MTRAADSAKQDSDNLKRSPYYSLGRTWRAIVFAAGTQLRKIFAHNNNLLITGDGVQLFTSPDGYIWTSRTVSTWATLVIQGIAYANSLYVAVTDGGSAGSRIATSPDLGTWTIITGVGGTGAWLAIARGTSVFMIIGTAAGDTHVMTSPDGTAWTARSDPPNLTSLTHCVFGGGKFVVLGTGGTERAAATVDGITWTDTNLPAGQTYGGLCYGDNKWVAVTTGTTGKSYTSTDGLTWVEGAIPPRNWNGVMHGNGVFVAWSTSTSGIESIATSLDGITWTLQGSPYQNLNAGVYFRGFHWLISDQTGADARVLRATT